MITQKRLKQLIHYDPETGIFTWRVNRARLAKAGQVAGGLNSTGYINLCVGGHKGLAHHFAHLYMTGKWPDLQWPLSETDHINGVRSDNRWANLRFVPRAKNLLNRKTYRTSTSGRKGVTWHQRNQRWRVRIQLHGKRLSLGCYGTKTEAEAAYRQAEKIYYGEFARKE